MDETPIPDQRRVGNAEYGCASAGMVAVGPSEFARGVVARFPRGARILELGCGRGRDACCFAEAGHRVVATDFSIEAIARNHEQYGETPNLAFVVADLSRPLPFAAQQFDVVYASLSLHYFRGVTTRQIFAEIARVLKPGGMLCFVCKSTQDPLYGQGEPIEDGMFVLEGHVRHFFSEAYARSCLGGRFQQVEMESGRTELYGEPAGVVKVIAIR